MAAADHADRAIREAPPQIDQPGVSTLQRWLEQIEGTDELDEVDAPTDRPAAVATGEELDKLATVAAGKAFRATMPMLTSRGNTRAYIACVAKAQGHGFISSEESRSMMYTAQLALAAYKPRGKGK